MSSRFRRPFSPTIRRSMIKKDVERMTEKELEIKIQNLEVVLPHRIASLEKELKELTALCWPFKGILERHGTANRIKTLSMKLVESVEEITILESELKSR
jgi:hypothetical protein